MAHTLQVMAHDGDTVDQLCWRHLGRTAGVTEATLANNPGLAAQGPRLRAGTLVALALPDASNQPTQPTVHLWD